MALFDKILGNTSQIANSLAGKATTYVVSNAVTKVSEATNKLADTLGVNLPFDKLGAALPTVKDTIARAIREGDNDMNSSPFMRQQIEAVTNALDSSVSASQLAEYAPSEPDPDAHKISLWAEGVGVIFDVMPQITEQHSVAYEEVQALQSPGPFQKFRGTGATVWTINAMFIARNVDEATASFSALMRLRGWTKPFFGERTGAQFPGMLGAPPPVVMLKGLRDRLIGPVPAVIQSLTWDWPRDVDYLPTHVKDENGQAVPFPAVLTVAITLYESYSPDQMNSFSLQDYRDGKLDQAFNVATTNDGAPR